MKKLLPFIAILLLLSCSDRQKENVYLPKVKFKRTKNPNYSQYFPSSKDSTNQKSTSLKNLNNTNASEPLPSFESQPISNQSNVNKEPSSFFHPLFSLFKSENEHTEEKICSDILEINKTILAEQNQKLSSLMIDKKKLIDEINNQNNSYQKEKSQSKRKQQRLEAEINRLNKLIKILSSEIK